METQAERFRHALEQEKPLQIVGVINAYVAIMAVRCGYRALYLSGAGVANASYGLPDLGLTTLDNVLEDLHRIRESVDLPILVDIDTGWGNELTIARTIKLMGRAGASAVHIEDQHFQKRCGHRNGKKIVSKEEMVGRIKAAVDAREGDSPLIMARCDALGSEGLERTMERAVAYVEAGADLFFPEAFTTLEQYLAIKRAIDVPVLANITEFGQTPLFTTAQLASVGIDMALYPLSAWRAMNLAALRTLQEIRHQGTQVALLESMQTREELYGFLNYEYHEKFISRQP
jgi:methylisocitrate lyase